jgi:phospholipid/cholesterol/gamma-HCH transport system substrate-binding protein
MRTKTAQYVRFLAVFALIGSLGLAASAYVLIHQRLPVPFRDVYRVNVDFSEAPGVVKGLGQPVNVAGVKVGQVSDVRLVDGAAHVTLEIKSKQLPRVYRNATATLEPITPLQDMQIALDPGDARARALSDGATLGVDRTKVPVPLSDLLSTLDVDTRTFLSSLISSLDQGTRGRGRDMRRMLLALAPTTDQIGRISGALDQRRAAVSRLVHNLAVVTRAASRDGRLADVVRAGNTTLAALAEQERPLRAALTKLPATLDATRSTLTRLGPFATKLGPTLGVLTPAVRRLPATFHALRPFVDTASSALRREIRPLVREARPLVHDAAPAVEHLTGATPKLARSALDLEYLFNELAYNPPGDDEGGLFWLSWAIHNINSIYGTTDAHGGSGRAIAIAACNGIDALPQLAASLGVKGVCPK